MTAADHAQRERALDALGSFCVSAPAGSGKTELLIQRYLALLSRVEQPEQVLAITFTRKAAAEMRSRVAQALAAAGGAAAEGGEHRQRTRQLARQALAADRRQNWQLVRDAGRMNIRTIDSFCAALTRQMPVLSRFGGPASAVDDAEAYYAEAALELFDQLDEDARIAPDLTALMLHFDNDRERLQRLLVDMLARRDQWQAYVGIHHAPEESEAYLLDCIERLVEQSVARLRALLAPWWAELVEMQCWAAGNLGEAPPSFAPDPAPLAALRALRRLLLTTGGDWRRRLDRSCGFPPGRGAPAGRKARMQTLIGELAAVAGLRDALVALDRLPSPEPGSRSWALVLHLSRILPLLEAHLLLVFQRHGVVDHCQVALSALQALGEDDAPTDLALRLDYRIEHILVDEFQDTAALQFELLRRLTRGWGAHNAQYPDRPRTLLVVGDGMQSIYGFRSANVGLFLRAREEGFNGVRLEHLVLRSNFRSDPAIVTWVNDAFAPAFPARDDSARGEVRFTGAVAARTGGAAPAVGLHAFPGQGASDGEVTFVCDALQGALADSAAGSLALLGRSRSHLQPFIETLRRRGIPHAAPELSRLAGSPVAADLLTLCRALASHADRVAWLSLLRSPLCGLSLADLLVAGCGGDDPPHTPVWRTLSDPALPARLGDDARRRLSHLVSPLGRALQTRDRRGLRAWVESLWLALGGPATAIHESELADAESFFQLLEQAELEGRGLDPAWLGRQLERRAAGGGDPAARLQVMTLHRAKGLEFDRVFLVQLARRPRGDERPLLLWDEFLDASGRRGFLLAADDRSRPGEPTLYNYLRERQREKTLLENTRLLYVGATRAAQQLTLTATVELEEGTGALRTPSRGSLLHPLWHCFSAQAEVHPPTGPGSAGTVPAPGLLCRQVLSALPSPPPPIPPAVQGAPVGQPADYRQQAVHTVVRQALGELSRRSVLPATCGDAERARWALSLQRQGLWGDTLAPALEAVAAAVALALSPGSPGRWVLAPEHADARSGWTLNCTGSDGGFETFVVDRSFIDRDTGIRWLVDYRPGRPSRGQTLSPFLAQVREQHRDRLLRYGRMLPLSGSAPLRFALYFTELGLLEEVPPYDTPGTAGRS